MRMIYVDGDACPVKAEVYRVASRYHMVVKVVANALRRVPAEPRDELMVCPGFGAADDWIAEHAGAGDIVVTADIPLAARCLDRPARVLDPKGRPLNDNHIGGALAQRQLLDDLRQGGERTGGPPMTAKDRSRFLVKLEELLNAVQREHPSTADPQAD